ncbi:hypothetical protein L3X38_001724 [Prunus dulcis]|uniref:Retrovirus-related Pol polyprotein from transposon RE1 n=1 Tax=Prunus dulcis TaxID=3755 RepID=A0AAD4WUM2_PRUDU|nr:hypothetical protein L3X38_001724 [Prunus dulcis]
MEQNLKLTNSDGEMLNDPSRFRRLVGRLINLTITRLEITYAVNILSQFTHQPKEPHLDAALRILRYLKGSPGQGLLFSLNSKLPLIGYCESNWANRPMTKRSTSGYCVFLGIHLSPKTKKQKTVSRSSAEAEYRSMATATCELTWLRYLLKDLQVTNLGPAKLFCDNQVALHIAANPVYRKRTKHIESDCHVVREKIQAGQIATSFVPSVS